MIVKKIQIKEYDYPLPDERIAKYPLEERDDSKLLLYTAGKVSEDRFSTLADHLPFNSYLVFNNTKVIQARLKFRKETGAMIEIFCLEPHTPHDYALIFQTNHTCRWVCMVGNSKRWREEVLERDVEVGGVTVQVTARRVSSSHEASEVEFVWSNPEVTFADLLSAMGELPIPPYLNRATEALDEDSYQTIYSKIKGSVAAPTAGLHFTDRTFRSLKDHSMEWGELTLHVGAGTFRPVKSEQIADHEMHAETFSVERRFMEELLLHIDSVIAVGTTSVRTLESLYYIGCRIVQGGAEPSASFFVSQWQPYEQTEQPSPREAIAAIVDFMHRHDLDVLHGATQIIIVPGYQFKLVRGIITNFHQPRSTLLLLISAYLEGNWKTVYDYALTHDFRFLSYGDSSLLLR